jgi:ABC-type branched-subunit amino acid transport system ATPase component
VPTSPDPAAARPEARLAVSDVTAGYTRRVPVVRSVSLGVGAAEVVSVIGPNGAGKSTLLKTLTGNLPKFSGTVRLAGQDVTRLPTHKLARHGLSYVPQVNEVFGALTVHENLEMGGFLLARRQFTRRLDEVLTLFPGLRPLLGRRAHKLSGGERKMLAIARALIPRPTLVVLDEPTAGLSDELAHRVLTSQVRAVARGGAGVLLVEQRVLAALSISDWGYVMVAGQVVLSAAGRDLLTRADFAERFLGRAPAAGGGHCDG